MTGVRRGFGGLAFVIAFAACTERPEPAGAGTVVDSAGVRVVTYDGMPEATRRITFAAEPEFRHGHREGDHPFQMIVQGALDPSGGAVVYDLASRELVRIGPDGVLDKVLARSGQGPAEVMMVRSIQWLGPDTLLVEDRGNGKLMYFADGDLAHVVSTLGGGGPDRSLTVQGVDGTGAFMLMTSSYSPRFTEQWLAGAMARFDRSRSRLDTVAHYDLARRVDPDGTTTPWGPSGRATVSGVSFVSARTDIPQITWRRAQGSVHQVVRWDPQPDYPTEADWEVYIGAFADDMRANNPHLSADMIAPLIGAQLERFELRRDEAYPLFEDLESDGAGGVWLGVFRPALAGPAAYHVVAPDGTWLGLAELPDRFAILDVQGHRVLGVLSDELGVQSVAVFRILVEPL